MITRYSSQRGTNRWPLALFYNMMDIAALATYIVYYENNDMLIKKTDERRLFLRQLGEELARPIIENRASNNRVTRVLSTKTAIECIIGEIRTNDCTLIDASLGCMSEKKAQVGYCYLCNQQTIKKKRKTRKACDSCSLPICCEHSISFAKCMKC